jgi:hypothetical protein
LRDFRKLAAFLHGRVPEKASHLALAERTGVRLKEGSSMMRFSLGLAALLAHGTSTQPAVAAVVEFSGTRNSVDAPGPQSPRCGSRATTNVVHNPPTSISVGLSNAGAFNATQSHCVQIPLSAINPNVFDLGEFTFDFGGGQTLFGTYSGVLTFVSPGVFAITQTNTVTGGTGGYFGAAGSFQATGTLTFPQGRPTVAQTFAGRLNLPVPEPSTWAMLIAGFGFLGAALRRRQSSRMPSAVPL